MNNILKIALTLAVGIVLAGCYNDFDNPAPAKVYTDKDFTETGAEIISIKDLKAKFYEKWGHDANGLGRRVVIEDDVEIVQQVAVEEEEIVEEQPFLVAETMPSFQGGSLNDFRNWVQSKVRYPAIAQENGISGKVVLTFVIEKDGRLTNIQVLQTPDRSLSEEAIRVLQQSPKWSPGKQRNQPVRVRYTLPVEFRIQQ